MDDAPRPHLIACGILKDEIERLRFSGALRVSVQYLSRGLHIDYGRLHRALSGALSKTLPRAPGGIVVVYGDVCLGFKGEMKALMAQHGVIKVNALNCIDCLLGGKGRLLEIDPEHKMLFLNPAFIDFTERLWQRPQKEVREMFSMLEGIILLDAMGDLDAYEARIREASLRTGLPVLERKNIGLGGLKAVIGDALNRMGPADRSDSGGGGS